VIDSTANKLPDQLLVSKVLSGDTHGFASIIKNTEGLVAQLVFKMIPNSEDRKDIAQDIYLKAFQQLPHFRFQAKLSTWIGQIAYHTCLNYLEKKKLYFPGYANTDEEEDPLEILSNPSVDWTNSEPENMIFKKELSSILQLEINKLSPLYKVLITLYHNAEISYAEIGQITQLPEGTVKNYLFRARKTLRNNLLLTYKKEAL